MNVWRCRKIRRAVALGIALFFPCAAAHAGQVCPRLSVDIRADGAVELLFRGNPGAPYQMERATSLVTGQWYAQTGQTSATPVMSWVDAEPPWSSAFYRVLPTAEPFTPAQLANAAEYSRTNSGAAVVVMQNGSIVFEDYHNGADSNTATHIHSATKGFWSCALAAAIQEGLISGYDEVVSDTITEWQDTTNHPGKSLITVGHLAALASGLSQDVDYIQGTDPLASNIYDYVVNDLRVIYMPGTTFQYGPSHYYAFGVLLQRKLALAGTPMNPLEYLQSRVLTPLGIEYVDWVQDDAGNPHIPNGCTLRPRQLIKLGRFLLQAGWWNDKALIDSGRMTELREAGGPNPGHGKFLWLNGQDGYPPAAKPPPPPDIEGGFIYYDGYTDIFAALGAYGNRMFIIPARNAVVVRQAPVPNYLWEDTRFLAALLGE